MVFTVTIPNALKSKHWSGNCFALTRLADKPFTPKNVCKRKGRMTNKFQVLAAGPKNDGLFQRLLTMISELEIRAIDLIEEGSLLNHLQTVDHRPATLVLSSKIKTKNWAQLINKVSSLSDANIVFAAEGTNLELERDVRAAGIFFYLLLPNEIQQAKVVIEKAIEAYFKK